MSGGSELERRDRAEGPAVQDNPDRRSMLLCLAWIAAALLAGALVWGLSRSYRSDVLIDAVNKSFAQSGDSRRIERLGSAPFSLVPSSFGVPFAVLNSDERAFVFTVARNGSFAACVALLDNSGRVTTVVPLSGNAAQIIEELPLPIFHFYTARIEKAAQLWRGR